MADPRTPAGLVSFLSSTPYAAKHVEVLSGGMSGFTYRVQLERPLEEGTTSVVVKHTVGYASLSTGMALGVERMDFEHEALEAIGGAFGEGSVRVPRVWWYDPETHTLVMEDVAPARTLSTEVFACADRGDWDRIEKLGAALGDFMGRFHQWGSEPAQAPLRARFLGNTTSRDTVFPIRWDLARQTATKYGMQRAWMDEMIQSSLDDARAGGPVVAMADFWFDNILVSESEDVRVYIVDWEMARCARPELDVAHFACAAYSCVHVRPELAHAGLMRAFFKAYAIHGRLDPVHMGIHAGRDVMSFGVMMPWVRHTDDSVKQPLAQAGLELLEAAHTQNQQELAKHPVVRAMFD